MNNFGRRKTELREGVRGRAAKWSGTKMSTTKKKEKEKERGEEKDRPDWVENLEKRIMNTMDNQSDLLIRKMEAMEKNMDKKIDALKAEVQNLAVKIKEIESNTQTMEKELLEKNRILQEQMALMECKILENHLRFRGIPEMKGEVRQEMIDIISEFIEKSQEEVEQMCDDIYRVKSDFIRNKNLPRDIIVKLLAHKDRDLILAKHFQEPMEISGKGIKIWKELSKTVIQQRKAFKQLIDKLIQKKIRYRWEIPNGVSFMFENRRLWIKMMDQMREFITTKLVGSTGTAEEEQRNQNGS